MLTKLNFNPCSITIAGFEGMGRQTESARAVDGELVSRASNGRWTGSGNPKGRPADVTALPMRTIREMIVEALDRAGGVDYLTTQAFLNPSVFMALVSRVLPMQITGDPEHPIAIQTKPTEMLDFQAVKAKRQAIDAASAPVSGDNA